MCITYLPRPNRNQCSLMQNTTHFLFIEYLDKIFSFKIINCMKKNMSILVTEIDVNNILHSMEFNFTGNVTDIDTSQIKFPNVIWYVRPMWEVILKTLVILPLVIGGIIGNLILLHSIVKFKSIQTPTNILIACMAAIDLITIVLCPWMFLVHHFFQNYELGIVGCKLEGFLAGAFMIMNVILLAAVSCDRLTAIILPREARLTIRGVFYVLFTTVLFGIVFASPLSIYRSYRERQWLDFLETYCSESIKVLPVYWHVLLSTLVWFPIIVMVICYSTIFWKLDKYEKEILRREHPITVNYKMRVARTLFIVLITFIACRLPFTILVFWRNAILKKAQINAVSESFQVLWFISHYLIYVNCAINPVIYGLTNENYKRVLNSSPLYKWMSGRNNLMKVHQENFNVTKKISDGDKRNWCLNFFTRQQLKTEIPTLSNTDGKRGSQNVVCSKITPLSENYL